MPTILLGFLLSWAWSISSRLLQQSAAAAPYLGQGYLLTVTPPNLECGIAPLGPPVPVHSHRSLDVGLLLPAAAPGLGRGVTPLDHA